MVERVAIMVISAHGAYPVDIKNVTDIYNFGVYELDLEGFEIAQAH